MTLDNGTAYYIYQYHDNGYWFVGPSLSLYYYKCEIDDSVSCFNEYRWEFDGIYNDVNTYYSDICPANNYVVTYDCIDSNNDNSQNCDLKYVFYIYMFN